MEKLIKYDYIPQDDIDEIIMEWDFVKDLALILIINSILMILTGIYKIGYLLKKKTI